MANVTFVDDNSNADIVVSTDNILNIKVFTNNVRVRTASKNFFATLDSYVTNRLDLFLYEVEIFGDPWDTVISFNSGLTVPYPTSWDSVETASGGEVVVNTSAALVGTYGSAVSFSGAGSTANGRKDESPIKTSYQVKYYFDINTLELGTGDLFRPLTTVSAGSPVVRAFELQLREVDGDYKLRALTFSDDIDTFNAGELIVTPGANVIELFWKASTGDGDDNGLFAFKYNGSLVGDPVLNIDNDLYHVDILRIGAREEVDANTSGTMYIDDVRIRAN